VVAVGRRDQAEIVVLVATGKKPLDGPCCAQDLESGQAEALGLDLEPDAARPHPVGQLRRFAQLGRGVAGRAAVEGECGRLV
jgi:hypothetical protein